MFRKLKRSVDLYQQLLLATRRNKAVLIYQMGKVGSTSLYHYLQSIDLDQPVFRVHRFRLDNDDYVKRGFIRNIRYRYWAWLQYRILKNCRLKVIVMTRQPGERNLSDFFQTITTFEKRGKFRFDQLTPAQLQQVFLAEYPHQNASVWFDQQVKAVFGIDVFQDTYKHCRNGALLYQRGNVDLLVFRLEDRERCVHDVAEFLGIPDFTLPKGNSGSNKWYAGAYREVKKVPLPDDYLKQLADTDYYRFFYTGDRFRPLD